MAAATGARTGSSSSSLSGPASSKRWCECEPERNMRTLHAYLGVGCGVREAVRCDRRRHYRFDWLELRLVIMGESMNELNLSCPSSCPSSSAEREQRAVQQRVLVLRLCSNEEMMTTSSMQMSKGCASYRLTDRRCRRPCRVLC